MTTRNYTAELQRRVGKRCYGHHFVGVEGSDFSHCTECGAAWHKRDGGPIPHDPPDVSTLHGALIAASKETGHEIWVSHKRDTFTVGFAGHVSDKIIDADTPPAACEAIAKLAIEHVESEDAEEKI